VEVCPVECIIDDAGQVESCEALLAKYRTLTGEESK